MTETKRLRIHDAHEIVGYDYSGPCFCIHTKKNNKVEYFGIEFIGGVIYHLRFTKCMRNLPIYACSIKRSDLIGKIIKV